MHAHIKQVEIGLLNMYVDAGTCILGDRVAVYRNNICIHVGPIVQLEVFKHSVSVIAINNTGIVEVGGGVVLQDGDILTTHD